MYFCQNLKWTVPISKLAYDISLHCIALGLLYCKVLIVVLKLYTKFNKLPDFYDYSNTMLILSKQYICYVAISILAKWYLFLIIAMPQQEKETDDIYKSICFIWVCIY
jgi:hypothetical protein